MTAKFSEDGFDQVFGFRARDEDGWCDVEREAVELLLAGDVLDGLVREAAENEAVVAGLLMGSERAVAVGVQRGARDSERVEKQQERVAVGISAKIWRRVKLSGGAREGFAEGGWGGCQWLVLRDCVGLGARRCVSTFAGDWISYDEIRGF